MCTFAEVFRTNCSHYPAASAEAQIQIGSDSEEHISPPSIVAGMKKVWTAPVDLGVVSLFSLYRNNKIKRINTKRTMAYMSKEGYENLVAELHRLEAIEMPKASAAIAEARDKGDLSENSEYDAAKEAQAHLAEKINQMKSAIADAKIVDKSRLNTDAVQLLSKVEMTNLNTGAKMTYTIVSANEANLREGKISIETPIAKALLNHKVGETVDAKIPNGVMKLKIENISY